LENVKKGKYLKEHMIDEDLFEVDEDYYLLFITEEHIVYINIKEKNVMWEFDTGSLRNIEKDQDGIRLIWDNKCESTMLLPEKRDVERAMEMLKNVLAMKSYSKNY